MKPLRLPLVLSAVLSLGMLSAAPAAAAELAGQRFDDTGELAGQPLLLNGLGIRAIFFFRAYVAGLYLGKTTHSGPEAMAMPGPKRLRIHLLMDASASDIDKALTDGIRKNVTPAQWGAMQPRVTAFSAAILSLGAFRAGDRIDLDYVPEQGLGLSVNGKPQPMQIAGSDFFNAVLAIFVGDDPVDTRLRKGLLAQ